MQLTKNQFNEKLKIFPYGLPPQKAPTSPQALWVLCFIELPTDSECFKLNKLM